MIMFALDPLNGTMPNLLRSIHKQKKSVENVLWMTSGVNATVISLLSYFGRQYEVRIALPVNFMYVCMYVCMYTVF